LDRRGILKEDNWKIEGGVLKEDNWKIEGGILKEAKSVKTMSKI
jgi:hypothetical protein